MLNIKGSCNLGHKILIIGCAGAGKTTLAKKLQTRIGLPIIHMDNHYWQTNWARIPDTQWHQKVKELCQQPHWIMDGNYSKTLALRFQYATTVIFLDTPRWRCLTRIFIRRFRLRYNAKRDDIPSDCHERIHFPFYRWVWNYPTRARPDIIDKLKHFKGNIITIANKNEMKKILHSNSIKDK